MSSEQVQRVGVVGAGTMGAGIAGLAARAGVETVLCDIAHAPLETARSQIGAALDRAVAKGRLETAEADAARRRLTFTTALADLAGCGLAIEAAPERVELKSELIAQVAEIAPGAVVASNTSSIPISALARRSGAAERVVGLHFFNPPGAMRLVELVATGLAAPASVARARAVAEALGKEVVEVSDGPGFVVNRCARPYYLESLRMVEDGAAAPSEIDRVCVEDGGFPLGPFELMDLIGLDVSLEVTRSMWEQSFGEPRWRPSPIQVQLVNAGRLGRKAGGGFYAAGAGWRDEPAGAASARGPILERIVAQLVNEAAFAVSAGIATAQDVDRAMVVGLNHPRGPGEWASRLGRDRVVATLDGLWEREHDPRYRVAPALRAAIGQERADV